METVDHIHPSLPSGALQSPHHLSTTQTPEPSLGKPSFQEQRSAGAWTQETDPDLPVRVQESPAEAWVASGLLHSRLISTYQQLDQRLSAT